MFGQIGNVALLWKCPQSDYEALLADPGGYPLPPDYLTYVGKQRTYFKSAIEHGVEACFVVTIGINEMRREVAKLQRPWCFDSWDQVALNIFKEDYERSEAAHAAGLDYQYPIERILPIWGQSEGWILPPDTECVIPDRKQTWANHESN